MKICQTYSHLWPDQLSSIHGFSEKPIRGSTDLRDPYWIGGRCFSRNRRVSAQRLLGKNPPLGFKSASLPAPQHQKTATAEELSIEPPAVPYLQSRTRYRS
jgi:hypothetical protein